MWMPRFIVGVATALLLGIAAGCDSGGSSAPDVGDNDINVVLCIGDSITDGTCAPAGAPYPSRLATLSEKRVVNAGICGSTSDTGAGRINRLLGKHNPGYVCILYGVNDIDFGRGSQEVIDNLRSMIRSCKANQSVPLVATLLPTYDSHAFARHTIFACNEQIRALAKEEGARLVDLQDEFGTDRSLIQEDGLHPSDAGTQIIAASFNDKI